jgi:predicted Zn finger-like uncharacterized protein
MATPLTVACPQCKQQIKASDELVGKKVRCKGCGHVFVIAAGPAEKPKPAKPASAPAKAKAPAAAADDEGNDPYAFAETEEVVARCPHCANEIEPDAKICIHCGYNTVSRQRVETKKVIENTPADQFAWLLPGILSAFTVLVLLGLSLIYCFLLPIWLKGGDWEWLTYGGFKVWFVIMCLFGMFFAGKFAVQRLILDPTPPERVRG